MWGLGQVGVAAAAAAREHRRRTQLRAHEGTAQSLLPTLNDIVLLWLSLLDTWTLHRCMREI